LTIRATNRAAREATKLREANQLRAFALMLELAMEMVSKQVESIKQFVSDVESHPSTFPIPAMNPLGRLKRITDTISIENTGMVYMKLFANENPTIGFTKILDYADYLFTELSGLQEMVKYASLNHQDRLLKLSAIFEQTDKYIIDEILIAKKRDEMSTRIQQVRLEFNKSRSSPDEIAPLFNNYFSPLTQLIRDYMLREGQDETYLKLIYLSSKGEENYGYIITGYAKFAKELRGIIDEMEKNLKLLRTTSQPLLNSSFRVPFTNTD
jgi:hypothetical protein